ncbi:MAG: twin-arginine translocase TatA/TatE family subunit [Opitutaceae bacterium]|nr:twin-arginine translocase TatA/TatE family subunit [Opitutaceae bacterium]
MNFVVPQVLAFSLGPWEIILILAVVMLLFGAKKLPELAKGMGKSMKEFKKAMNTEDDDESDDKSTKNGATKSPKDN